MATRRPTQAQTVTKSAALSSEFGLSYATRLFGEEAIASLPLLKSGPNKGKPKGYVLWNRTVTAGYHPNVGGGVGVGVTVRAWIGEGQFSPEIAAMRGQWLGRMQPICGSKALLGPENRAQWMREEEARRADEAERLAEMKSQLEIARAAERAKESPYIVPPRHHGFKNWGGTR